MDLSQTEDSNVAELISAILQNTFNMIGVCKNREMKRMVKCEPRRNKRRRAINLVRALDNKNDIKFLEAVIDWTYNENSIILASWKEFLDYDDEKTRLKIRKVATKKLKGIKI